MPIFDELRAYVQGVARTKWQDTPVARTVPAPEDLTFGNTGKELDACVLYADLAGSTHMVDAVSRRLAAEYYKAFLYCAARLIRANSGTITAYDGDRVMAIFMGGQKCQEAVRTALELKTAVMDILNPEFAGVYRDSHRLLRHTVGIDTGLILAAKTGVRDDRDVVWVGPAANYASKLNSLKGSDSLFETRITESVYAHVAGSFSFKSNGQDVWQGPYSVLQKEDGSYVRHYRTAAWWAD